MRKNIFIIIFILIAIAAATLWTSYQSRPSIIATPQIEGAKNTITAAPDFSFETTAGKKADLNSLKGKIVILHFWATWCPPCVDEFPRLTQLANDMQDDVIVLAVSSDKSLNDIKRFTGKFPLPPNVYIIQDIDRAITHDLYQTFAYPETILIDRDGMMDRKIAGDADWTSSEMRAMLKQLTERD